ncbi:MAG: LLM class flavin-dependent oxidoreductase, partial [Actinobacteria bacterium]|nr:LLM class flavin-dependent oxidoreductase [Actinomycetota bacterium]
VRLAMWSLRLVVAVLLSALLVSALVVGMAPRVWGMLNAHDETAISLYEVGGFTGLAERSVVYDAKGRQIGVFQAENSQQTLISEIPEHVVNALLAIEDRNFRLHRGVDLRAVGRQVLANVNDGASGGASTITQQVVKNELLATLPRDGRYKLLQMRYAVLLERELSKDQILERWFNTNFYGYNAYGIKAAAEVYFGKDVKDLTIEEGAFLVGLVRAPSAYDPINNRSLSLSRFVTALTRVRDEGYITLTDDQIVRKVIRGCMADGAFSFTGTHYKITEYNGLPKPLQKPCPPVLIGAGGKRMLGIAAREADIVGINPSLTPGFVGPEVIADMSSASVAQKIAVVKEKAGARFDKIELNIRTFLVNVTDDGKGAREKLAKGMGVDAALIHDSPFALIGPPNELIETLQKRREQFGLSYVIVGGDDVESFAPVVAALAGK